MPLLCEYWSEGGIVDAIADSCCRLCAGVTVYSAFRKSGAQSGDWVVLLGAGGGQYLEI